MKLANPLRPTMWVALKRHGLASIRLGTLLTLTTLASCSDRGEQLPHDQDKPQQIEQDLDATTIDRNKLNQIAYDFHFQFFDENLNPVNLSEDETEYFLDLKNRSQVTYQAADDQEQEAAPDKPNGDDAPANPAPALASADKKSSSVAYKKLCEEKGVPSPPPFGKPDWEEIGFLSKDQIFSDSRFNPLYIWRWESKDPPGVCAATVRYKIGEKQDNDNKGANVEVVGIICQGDKKPKNACFWASTKNPFGKKIEDFELNGDNIPTTETFTHSDGSDKKGTKPLKCTFCHTGVNAFIVHPDTVLKKFAHDPGDDSFYTPVSKRFDKESNEGDKWGNPRWKKKLDDCGACHSFAKVNKVWCRDVLQKAIGKTMPPPERNAAGKITRTSKAQLGDYKADLEMFRMACASEGYALTIPE